MRVLRGLPAARREHGDDVPGPLLVSGPPSKALELTRALTEGGQQELVRRVGLVELERPELARSSALVYVVAGAATPADEHALRRADRQRIPIVCLILAGAEGEPPGRILPYVLATDVVRARALDRDAIDAVARRIGVRAPNAAWALARRLPALRVGVRREVVERTAIAAATLAAFSPRAAGSDLPALSLLHVRMALRLEAAGGPTTRAAEAAAVAVSLASGAALRQTARTLLRAPVLPSWVVRAGVAYAGTRALGQAALAVGERVTAASAGTLDGEAESTEPGSGEREPRNHPFR
jgi:hypothetical protein